MKVEWYAMGANARIAAVKLRPVSRNDLGCVHELLSNWEVVEYMLFPLCSIEDSEKFLREAIDQPPAGPWRSIVRAIVVPPSAMAGLCGIMVLRGSEEGEIWYLVKPEYWGRGLATEAASELVEFGFTQLRLHRIYAHCLTCNPASARVLEKLKLRCEGLCRRNVKIHGEWRDSLLYAVLAEEWQTGHPLAF